MHVQTSTRVRPLNLERQSLEQKMTQNILKPCSLLPQIRVFLLIHRDDSIGTVAAYVYKSIFEDQNIVGGHGIGTTVAFACQQ